MSSKRREDPAKTELAKEILGKLGFRRHLRDVFVQGMSDHWETDAVYKTINRLFVHGYIAGDQVIYLASPKGVDEVRNHIFPEQLQELRRKLKA